MSAVAIIGWSAAGIGVCAAYVVWRLLALRLELVARACHELRGPIAATRLGLELGARLGELSPVRLRALDQELGRAALALEDLALAGSGARVLPERSPIDVGELVADSVEAWLATARAQHVDLELRWAVPGGSAAVAGDRLRLAQATGNLIANALDHGDGAVTVAGRVDGSRVRIEVRDQGPGLPAPVAQLARRHRRGRGAGRGARGRGLAIALAIAEAHGGRLCSAPSDEGARLVLELPLAVGEGVAVPRG